MRGGGKTKRGLGAPNLAKYPNLAKCKIERGGAKNNRVLGPPYLGLGLRPIFSLEGNFFPNVKSKAHRFEGGKNNRVLGPPYKNSANHDKFFFQRRTGLRGGSNNNMALYPSILAYFGLGAPLPIGRFLARSSSWYATRSSD